MAGSEHKGDNRVNKSELCAQVAARSSVSGATTDAAVSAVVFISIMYNVDSELLLRFPVRL